MAFAAISFASVSCVQEEPHKMGEPDNDGCYGVYFPAQETDLNLDPAEPLTASIAVVRTVSTGNITVPVTLVDAEGIFTASELTFEDGQTESTIELTFADAEVGVNYSCSLAIEDPQYASKYSSNPVHIDFSVVREKWNDLGKGTWTDNVMFGFSESVTILQNDNNPNLFRVRMTGYTEEEIEGGCVFAPEGDEFFEFKILKPGDMVEKVKITGNGLINYAIFDTGVVHQTYGVAIWMVHPGSFGSLAAESYFQQNKVLQYQENGLPAGVQIAPYYYMDGVGGWNYTQDPGVVTLVFPGAILTDYSLEIETGLTEAGELPVQFTMGPDVASAKYAVYEGQLNTAQKAKFAEAIGDGTETAAKDVPEGGAFTVTMETTGVYTIIGVTFDTEGNPQESAVEEFSYVAKDDEVPVDIHTGMVATGKYGADYSSDNTLEYYIYGTDITAARVEIFTADDVEGKTEACIEALMGTDPLSAEEIAKINSGESLVGIFADRAPGTNYTMLVWATNGYEETIVSTTAKTTGKLEVTLEEMLGTYSVAVTSYYDGPLPDPETWILVASDDPEKGNAMLTAFGGFGCSDPIYATVDTDQNIISIPNGQFFLNIPSVGYDLYFMNGQSGDAVMFNIIGKGKFSGPSELFGTFIINAADGSQLGYYEAYSAVSGVKVVEPETEETPDTQAVISTVHNEVLTGNATPNKRIVMMNAEREVKAASFEVGSAQPFKTEKKFEHIEIL